MTSYSQVLCKGLIAGLAWVQKLQIYHASKLPEIALDHIVFLSICKADPTQPCCDSF